MPAIKTCFLKVMTRGGTSFCSGPRITLIKLLCVTVADPRELGSTAPVELHPNFHFSYGISSKLSVRTLQQVAWLFNKLCIL